MATPATLPSVRDAALPDRYIAAREALAVCSQIDECKEWADKSAAMASYARQADDTSLEQLAMRIRARAVRRCGELIRLQKESVGLATGGEHGGRSRIDGSRAEASSPRPTLAEAGISHKFSHQAQRVASIPEQQFEAAVESDAPPTITRLAAMGAPPKAADPVVLRIAENSRRPGFAAFTEASGRIRDFAEFCRSTDPAFAAGGGFPNEIADVRSDIATLDQWIDRFAVNLKGD